MRLHADLVVGLGLGLGLALRLRLGLVTVTGSGLGASNAGRGNALASSRGGSRGRRRGNRGTPSGIRASSSLGGARNGGGPSRFNQVLLRSVVWFGGATERHYHNKENGEGRAPAETGGPLFRYTGCFWSCVVASQSVAVAVVQSQLPLAACCFGPWAACCTARSAVRIQPKQARTPGHRGRAPPSPRSDEQA